MDKPRIRHIALNVQDRVRAAEYYKSIFDMEEKSAAPTVPSTFPMDMLMWP